MLPSSSQSEKKNITEIALKMEGTGSFGTSVTNCRRTRRHIPDEDDINSNALKNPNKGSLISYSVLRL